VFSKERTSLEPQIQLTLFAQVSTDNISSKRNFHREKKIDGGLNTSVVQHLPEEEIKWRLTKPSDGSDQLEEIVFRIQGVLCEKDLPPVRISNR
jgi:hypothetical protein